MVCEKRALREPWLPKTSAPRLHGRNTERAVTLCKHSVFTFANVSNSSFLLPKWNASWTFGVRNLRNQQVQVSMKPKEQSQPTGYAKPLWLPHQTVLKKNSLMFHSRNPDWRKQQKVVDWGVPLSFVSTFIFKPFFLVFWTQNIVH